MLTKSDITQIREVIQGEIETAFDRELKPIKKDLRCLKKTLNIVIKNYDEGDVKLGRRVTRIEKHLGLPVGSSCFIFSFA